ncbi:hypothetical protein Poli38472_005138 [Pythium oligandrum]|uniref:Hcy-binding domain-containing protein n=1 Tax=Pythium oligandrum TaxID=41045 RepID=A0A8K1FG96_PYTOL|nr:hypothetical protein Poli38472_005138 [Pythium oligandrum]|eukprot:TMW62520.1 hypothetical protein Poli38472_005138 [Pythium oligandrum]
MEPSKRPELTLLVGGGAVSHELLAQGLVNDRNMLSASALTNYKNHDLVVDVYGEYMQAGATALVTSNTHVVPGLGFTQDEIREYTRLAGRLAKEARQRANKEASVKIAGALPPLMPGYRSDRTIKSEDGKELYLLIGEALWPFVDEYIAESMSSLDEAKMAYEAVHHLNKPVMISFTLSISGQELRSGEALAGVVEKLVEFCDHLAEASHVENQSMLTGILFNCSQPEDIARALKHLQDTETVQMLLKGRNIVLGAYGDRVSCSSMAGRLEEKIVSGAMQSVIDQEVFCRFMERWIECGATIIGGCCGIPPKYIAYMNESITSTQRARP